MAHWLIYPNENYWIAKKPIGDEWRFESQELAQAFVTSEGGSFYVRKKPEGD